MSIPKISGRQARELLHLARHGTDLAKRDADHVIHRDSYVFAETVAWLYGREADEFGHQSTETEHIYTKRGQVVYVNDDPYREGKEYLTPDEAVDRARALLAAAEEARP